MLSLKSHISSLFRNKKQLERNEARQTYKYNCETLCPTTCLAGIWHHSHMRTMQCWLTAVSWLAYPHLHSGPSLITSSLKPQLHVQIESSLAKSGLIFWMLLITLWALLLAQGGTLQTKCVYRGQIQLKTKWCVLGRVSNPQQLTEQLWRCLCCNKEEGSARQVPSFQKQSGFTVILKLPGKMRQLFCKEQQDSP